MECGNIDIDDVSDAIPQWFFNLVNSMMQSHDNPNPVTFPLNCLAL